MVRGSGMRPRSRRMRRVGKMRVSAEPRGGDELKAGGRGIRDRSGGSSLGRVVKAGRPDSKVDKPNSDDSPRDGWIYVRGHRIEKAGLHIDPDGNVYVPDSEDEESGMEYQACGQHVSAGKELVMDLNPQVHDEAAVQAAGVEIASDMVADEDSRMKVPTEVPEPLKEVLANMDPLYHDVFVSMFDVEVKFMLFLFTMKADVSILLLIFFNMKDCCKGAMLRSKPCTPTCSAC